MQEIKNESIIKVKLTQNIPFCAVGIIQSIFNQNHNLQATATLITQRHAITVASNVYHSQLKKEAIEVYFYVQSQNQKDSNKAKIKVKNIKYSPKYLQACFEDKKNYQIAILELEQNQIIQKKQFLGIRWNWKRSLILQDLMIVGYPIDKQSKTNQICTFEQYMYKDKIIALYDNWLRYGHKLSMGTTGAPIIIESQGKYQMIGMHLGLMANKIRFGILFSSNLENSFNVLKNISKQDQYLTQFLGFQRQLKQNQKQKQKIQQLQLQIKTLKQQKQLMRLQIEQLKLK